MKAVVNVWLKTWVILLLLLAGAGVNTTWAQNVPGCDPLGVTPVVDFQLTYDPATNRYTAWYIPTDNTLHRTVTGQFTIITPNGFTTPGGNGRDANLQITNINGSWSDFVVDNELVTSVGGTSLSSLNGIAVHQVGMAPAGIDIDPDGTGPLTNLDPVTPGVAVPLFSFPGNGCASVVRILVNNEPVQNQIISVFGANINNEITIQIPRAAFVPSLERYCKNAPLNTVTILLPDIQDDTQTVCATTTSYSNNYFTQVLRNWNPASLPAGTIVVPTANQVWSTFTVTPAAMQGNVSIDPVTGAYTVTFPTLNGVTQPGSLTICNSLRDVCNTATDQACVVISWLSSGTVSITNTPTVCLSGGPGTASLTATSGFTNYDWTGPGLMSSTGNPVTVTLPIAGIFSYTVVATTAGSCTATNTTSLTVVRGADVSSFTATNPTSCSGTDGTLTLSGLTIGNLYSIAFTKNGVVQPPLPFPVNSVGQGILGGLSAGEYSFTITNGVCASTPLALTLTDPNSPATPNLTVTPSSTICLGNSFTLIATGVANASFNWAGSNLSQTTGNPVTATPNTSGSFVYTVTQTVGGCVSAPTSVTVMVNPNPTVTATTLSATACVGGSFSLSATPAGGTPGYTYIWTGPNFSTTTTANPVMVANATLASTGNYFVTVTDANQCSSTATTPVAVSVINCCSLTVTASASQTAICLGNSVTLTANPTGAIGALSYQWTPNVILGNSQSVSVTPTSTTTYTVVVTDSGAPNCIQIAMVTVVVNSNPVITNLTATPACVGQVLSLSATITGNVQQNNIIWKTPEGLTLSGNPLNRTNAQLTMSGNYTLIVSDVNSCTATQVVSTTVGMAPSVQVQPQQSCAGGTVTLSATGGATSYIWTGPNGFTATGQVIVLTGVDASDAGSYTVVVTGGNACTGVAQGVVAVNPLPAIKAGFVSTSVCVGSSLFLLGDITTGTVPTYTFSWTGPNGFASPLQNPTITSAQVSNSGSYTFVITDLNGCSATATTPVSVTVEDCCPPRNAQISITVKDPDCGSNSGTATATLLPATPVGTQVTYLWKNVATNTIVGSTSMVTGLTSGVYSVTVTETKGNCKQEFIEVTSISDTPGPDVSVSSISGANCGASNGSVQLIVTGGTTPYSVSWTGPSSGSMNSPGSPVQINGLTAGNYIFTVTGIGSSCKGVQDVSIPVLPTSLSLTAQVFQPVTCGTSGTIVASWNSVGGPYQLTIDGVSTPVAGTSQTLIVGAGTHSIQIASGNPLCVSDSKVVTINPVPAPPVAGWIVQQQPTCAGQSGIITFAGGQSSTTQYTLSYLNNTLIATTTGDIPRTYTLGAGMYVVTRLEPNACITTQTLEILAPTAISFNVKPTDGACGQPGTLVVTNITGGAPGYVVSYTGPVSGTTTEGTTINGLTAGMYTVSVTDSKGCVTSTTLTIGSSSGLNVTATISSATACVGGSFILNASVLPVGNYTYTWKGPNNFTANGAVVTVNPASLINSGSYTVVVTDASTSCTATKETTTSIIVIPCQVPCVIGLNVITTTAHCGQADGQATVTASGGSGSYTYHWSTGATTPTITALTTGTYSVTVIDAVNSACFSTTMVAVGNASGLQLAVLSVTPATCAGATGAASVTATGGSPTYTYQWSNGSVTSTLNSVVAGVYSVTVTDQTGCKDVELVIISSTPGNLTATASGTPSACGQATGMASVVASGSAGYSYLWSTGATTPTINSLVAGIYTVKVTDANGCSVTASVSIDDASGPQFTINKTNVFCQGGTTGTASVNVTSGIGQISYLWSTGAVTASISGLSAGTYSVVVTDGNGCKSSDQVTITQPTGIVAELSTTTIACGSTTGNITLVNITGGTPTYTYQWSNGAVTPSLTGVGVGSYTLTVKDALNCVAVGTATLTLPTNCTACQKPVLEVTGPVCNTATNTYSISYLVSAGASVTTLNGGTVNAALHMITGIPSGQNVVVIATNGCGAVSSATVVAPNCTLPPCALAPGLKVGQPVCNGTSYVVSVTANTGATITAFGGTVTGSLVTVVGSTNVTIVASIAGCSTSETVVVGGIDCTTPVPCTTPLVSVAGTSCESSGSSYSVKYFASAGVTVTSSPGVGVLNMVTQTITGIPLGVPVSLTASNGSCPPQVVDIPAPTTCPGPVVCPKPVLSVTGPVCNTATNTYSISYLVSAGASVTTLNGGTVNPLTHMITGIPSGQNVVVIATNGCGSVSSATVVAPNCTLPPCALAPGLKVGQPVCNGTSYVVSVTANTGATITAFGGTVTGSLVTVVGSTNVTIVASIAGCSTSETVVVGGIDCTTPVPCTTPLVSVAGTSCESSGSSYSVKYFASAGVTVTSSPGVGVLNTVTQTITGIPLGVPVSLTASNGSCPPQVVDIPAPTTCPQPCQTRDISLQSVGTQCGLSTGSATATLVPAAPAGATVTYQWTNLVNNTPVGNTPNLSGLSAGMYRLLVSITQAGLTCTYADTAVINPSDGIQVTPSTIVGADCGLSNGSLVFTATGGTAPYTVQWSGAATGTLTSASPIAVTGLVTGSYSFTISSAGNNTCVSYQAIDIPQRPSSLSLTASGISPTACGTNNGSIAVSWNAVPGNSSYQLTVNGVTTTVVGTSTVLSGLSAGAYTISVATSGIPTCASSTTTVMLNPTQAPPVSNWSANQPNCAGQMGSLVFLGGQSPTVQYTVTQVGIGVIGSTNGATAQSFAVGSGTYVVTRTEGTCVSSQTYVITVPPAIDFNVQVTPATCGQPGSLLVTDISGGTPQLTVLIRNAANQTVSAGNLPAGTYTVTVTDSKGCSAVEVVTITGSGLPDIASIIANNPTTCTGTDGSLVLTGLLANQGYQVCYTKNGNTPVCSALIANGIGQLTIAGLGAGIYTNITASIGGCVSIPKSATLNNPVNPPTPLSINPGAVCLGQSFTLVATGTPGATIQWTGPNGFMATGSPAVVIPTTTGILTYTVTQTVAGCTSLPATVTALVNPTPSITQVASTNPTSCTLNDGTITLTGPLPNQIYTVCFSFNGGNSVCQSLMSNPAGQLILTNLAAGAYSNITISAFGCQVAVPVSATLNGPLTPPTPQAPNPGTICQGQSVVLTASGSVGAIFQWSGPGVTASGNPVTVTPSVTGVLTYFVTQTVNGCTSAPATVTLVVNSAPTVTATISSATACVGGSFVLNATVLPAGNYTYTWKGPNSFSANGALVTVSPATLANSGSYTVVVTDAVAGCAVTKETITSIAVTNCTVCAKPVLSVTGPVCNTATNTYSISYLVSAGASVTTLNGGTVNAALHMITGIPSGQNVVVIATNGCGSVSSATVVAPNCTLPPCALAPGLKVGQPVCNGTSYVVSVTANTGATITAFGGTVTGSLVTVVGSTNVTIVASIAGCSTSETVVVGGIDCTTPVPCTTPLVSVAGTSCESSGSSYSVKYFASAGVTVTSSPGVGVLNTVTQTITGIPLGVPVSLTASNGSCPPQVVDIPAPTTCPGPVVCPKPVLEVTGPVCNTATNTYSISYLVSAGASVTTLNGGTVNAALHMITGIPSGQNVVVIATNGCGSVSSATVVAPNCTLPPCALAPGLKVGQPVCNGTSYVVSVTANTGATITAFGGTVTGSLVTVVGSTNVTIVASIAGCSTSETVVVGGIDCTTPVPCTTPLVSVAGTSCESSGSSYSVKYFASAGVTVTSSPGVGVLNTVTQTITGIPLGVPVSLTASNGSCPPQVVDIPAPTTCPGPVVCPKPVLEVTGPVCNTATNTYSISYLVSAGASVTTLNGGTVNPLTHMITGIPSGQNVVVIATNGCGSVSSATVVAPNCTLPPCALAPGLKVGQPVCNGTSYVVSVTANTGATITAFGGTVTGSLVTVVGSTNVTIVASIAGCSTSETVVVGGIDCTTPVPCTTPLVSVAGTSCESSGSSYSVKYFASAGVTVTSSPGVGVLNTVTQTITGIPLGVPVSLTASNGSCPPQVVDIPAPTTCPGPVVCPKPVLEVTGPVCNTATNTYSISYLVSAGASVTTLNGGTVNPLTHMITGIPSGQNVVVIATNGCGSVSSATVVAPNCTLPPCALAPGLKVGQPVCNGTSYVVSVTANTGATITAFGGTVTGSLVTVVGSTNVTIVASIAGCSTSETVVVGGIDCTTPVPCTTPLVSVAGTSCESSGSSYSVKYFASAGVTVTSSPGVGVLNMVTQTIKGIPLGVPVSLTASNGSCPAQIVNVNPPTNCPGTPVCQKPVLTVTGPVCNTVTGNTYSVGYTVSGGANVTASAGTVNTELRTVTGIATGQNVVIWATNTCGAVSSMTIIAPQTCTKPVGCSALAEISVGQAVCVNGTSYMASVTATSGATLTALGGQLNGSVVTGVIGSNVTVIATIAGCNSVTAVIASPASCTDVCTNPLVSVAGVICQGTTYSVKYTAPVGVTITASDGVVMAATQTITGIPAGTPLILTAVNGTCPPQTVPVSPPVNCTVCSNNNGTITVPAVEEGSRNWLVNYNFPIFPTVIDCFPNLAYLATDAAGTILYVSSTPSFTGVAPGTYLVYPTTYPITSVIGKNITNAWDLLMDYPCGWVGSAPYIVTVCPPTNEPPLVPGHPVVTEPGKPVTICLPITDPNVGDTHTVQLCAQPAHGTVTTPLSVNNTTHTVCFTYTPTPGYTGLDQVCLITCDQGGLCDTTYVPITIVPISPTVVQPKPPVVPVTPIVTITGEPKTECYPILDPNVGDTHSYTVCGQPQHGTANVSIDNTTHQICVTYTPNAGYSGPDELCLHICDQTGLCTDVIVPIVVIPKPGPPTQPQPPTVVPPVIVTPVDVPQTVCVQINDPNFGDIHTASICGQPTAGTVTVGPVNNQTHMVCVTYTPPPGYSGQPLGGCLQVCDQAGLCIQVPITITVIPGPTTPCPTIAVLPFPSDPTTCTANNGSLTLTGLTAGQSYTVCYTKNLNAPFCQTLTANQNGRILVSGLGVGVYTNITVGQNGCTSNTVSVTLTGGLPAPSATCSVTAICAGQSITLTASGTNIQWTGPGLQTTTGSPVTAIPNVTGIVTYMATQSANGCVSPPATVTVVVKPTPTFSVSATNPTVCNGTDGKITLTGLTPGQSYTVCYTKDAGVPVCAERLANVNGLLTITGLSAGSYTNITVNELGCLSTAKAVILTNPVLPDPQVTVAPSTTVCLGQAVSLTATGEPGAAFTWKGQGLLGTTGSVVTVNPQSTGTLSYTVTQTIAGCGSSSAVTAITVNPVPSAIFISKQDPNSCANPNGIITLGGLLANQTYTVCYRVNNMGSAVCLPLSSNGTGVITISGLTAGAYSVTVSNGGCSSQPVSATLVGQTPAQPNVTVLPSATICIGQSVTMTASSSVSGTFSWTGPDLSGITGGTITTTPMITGVLTYTVTQTVNGCTSIPAVVPVTVLAIPAPTVVATTAPTTCSGTNGSITLGGLTANLSYTVCYSKNGAASQCTPFIVTANGQLVVTGLASGSYSLTVLSTGGCHNAVPVSASVASSTACSMCTDAPLIVAQPLLICKDSTKTVYMQIIDADLSDSFSATVCGAGMSNATVTVGIDNQTRQLFITYKAAPGFQGIDQVCVTVTDKCGNFDQVYVPVQVIRCVCGCTGTPPVVVPQPIITTKNNPKEICVPIVDTPTDSHTATVCGGPQHGTVEVSVNNTTHMLCVKYTPNTDYVGTDKVCITICDQTNRCTVIEVPITVVDVPNPPALSVVPLVTNCSSTTTAYMPIIDINADNTHSVLVVSQPLNGTISAMVDQATHRVLITYTPAPGFTGNDKAVVRVTDSDGLSSADTDVPLFVTPGTCPTCVTMELKVLLEGPYNTSTHKMNTVLNQRGLLPGQTPIGQFAVATPAGQPYNTAPWNYTGTESVTTYGQDIVDWVLVSLRTDELSTTPVFRVAGLLHDDGRITFVNPCFSIPDGAYHVVIEHRNHMGVMSPTKVSIINNKLLFDFTVQDSYTIADPPSFGEIAVDGKWMMYGGDGKKDVFSDNFDINFFDSKLWKDESGIFDQYKYGDFNMDADVNFVDSVLWKKNNGRYSKVPH